MRIEKLTPAQIERIPEFRDRWRTRSLATGPCDRAAMETAVDEVYRWAGLPSTPLKIWLDSPLAGTLVAKLLTARDADPVGTLITDQITYQAMHQVRTLVTDQVADEVRALITDQITYPVTDQVWPLVADQVVDEVRTLIVDQAGGTLDGTPLVQQGGYGHYDAGWLAFYDFFGDVCGLPVAEKIRGLLLLAGAGWWWPFSGACIITERPSEVHCDDAGRLHNSTGAALLYPDRWGVYAVHGVRVPADVIEHPESITAARIQAESDAEVRRVMIERYGSVPPRCVEGYIQARTVED